jgi:SAM-dependent methyltransferase
MIINKIKNKIMELLKLDVLTCYTLPKPDRKKINKEYQNLRGGACIQKLLESYKFNSVLDIGCGQGEHSDIFYKNSKDVTAIDYGNSRYFQENKSKINAIVGDYTNYSFCKQFDCVWASHILEHTLNVHEFLLKMHKDTKEGGVVAITVPPLHFNVVGGHVNLFTSSLLLYKMILAGFDCKNARVLEYGWNISIIVEKNSIDVIGSNTLNYDYGDIKTLKQYFPLTIQKIIKETDTFLFEGHSINWD